MKLKTILAAGALLAMTAVATGHPNHAPTDVGDPISLRQAAMADIGKLTGVGFAMVKGEAEYNPVVAKAVLTGIHAGAVGIMRMFPKNSTSDTSVAKDTIWSDRKGFRQTVAKFVADAEAAEAADVPDLDAFKAQIIAVAANCKSCHENYRIKKN